MNNRSVHNVLMVIMSEVNGWHSG